ncbi:hypothetical protein ACFL0Q_00700 [Thermodesulfobacteriota bacterium]
MVSYNRISYFWDGISTYLTSKPKEKWVLDEEGTQNSFDICNNFIYAIVDDAIEVDGIVCNIRVQRNRIMNSLVGISLQECRPGPIYVTQNVLSNFSQDPYKMLQRPSGVRLFHNTSTNWGFATYILPPDLRNSMVMNNILLGYELGLIGGSTDLLTILNHNAYRRPTGGVTVRWSDDGGETWSNFEDLQAFQSATTNESHGIVVTEHDFIGPLKFDAKGDYRPEEMNLQLSPESNAIDAGYVLPTVNDGYTGKGPDLGAYESGLETPKYGPRMGAGKYYGSSLEEAEELPDYETMKPIGVPLTLKEVVAAYIDIHNVTVPTIAMVSFLGGLLAGSALVILFVRVFHKRGSGLNN